MQRLIFSISLEDKNWNICRNFQKYFQGLKFALLLFLGVLFLLLLLFQFICSFHLLYLLSFKAPFTLWFLRSFLLLWFFHSFIYSFPSFLPCSFTILAFIHHTHSFTHLFLLSINHSTIHSSFGINLIIFEEFIHRRVLWVSSGNVIWNLACFCQQVILLPDFSMHTHCLVSCGFMPFYVFLYVFYVYLSTLSCYVFLCVSYVYLCTLSCHVFLYVFCVYLCTLSYYIVSFYVSLMSIYVHCRAIYYVFLCVSYVYLCTLSCYIMSFYMSIYMHCRWQIIGAMACSVRCDWCGWLWVSGAAEAKREWLFWCCGVDVDVSAAVAVATIAVTSHCCCYYATADVTTVDVTAVAVTAVAVTAVAVTAVAVSCCYCYCCSMIYACRFMNNTCT